MRPLRYWRPCAFALIVAMMATTVPTRASATNWSGATGVTGCNGGLNMADNGTHTFVYTDLTSKMADATYYARVNAVELSDVTTTYDSTPDGNTDVDVRDGALVSFCGYDWWQPATGGVIGLASCESLASGSKCQQHKVRYSSTFSGQASTTVVRWLACHEIGHTLGLEHREDWSGSMPSSPPEAALSVTYDSHSYGHLNTYY